jgi:hypothetical protein
MRLLWIECRAFHPAVCIVVISIKQPMILIVSAAEVITAHSHIQDE